ncbi:pathogenesis-related thaumatin-like protein 3.5 [Impatiens glandulifera]|uniref:pathogenesis-related thaumatin-like protein 3.5 n=1 Tax=Impatiens glandulifera TaxID=253017 RepID=UPI001FB19FA6|nr:pathogenesis-related thaumatin-like protein 3.5 [Impatiens glandulifera]
MALPLVLSILLILVWPGSHFAKGSRTFTISNGCKETIWPAITPSDTFSGGGFMLKPGESRVFTASVGWSGRIWGRTGCNFDKNGIGKCQTGACGNKLKCTASGEPPATLAEVTLASPDFYDISLVDGFNVPMSIQPIHGKAGNCSTGGCDSDLRLNCPSELSVKVDGKTVSCRSACDVFNTDEYCCRGVHGNPSTCEPSYYSKLFKGACPTAYSYAYDDPTSILTCSGSDYIVSFCTPRKQKQCTYHNNKLACSGSKDLKPLIKMWWAMMVSLPLMIMMT